MLAMIGDVLNFKVLKGRQKSLTKFKKKNKKKQIYLKTKIKRCET